MPSTAWATWRVRKNAGASAKQLSKKRRAPWRGSDGGQPGKPDGGTGRPGECPEVLRTGLEHHARYLLSFGRILSHKLPGDALFLQADVAGARRRYEAALKLAQEAQQDDRAAQIQTGLAVVALEEKRFADGEALARGSMAVFDKDKAADNGAWARAVLAQIFLAEGKAAAAQSWAGRP